MTAHTQDASNAPCATNNSINPTRKGVNMPKAALLITLAERATVDYDYGGGQTHREMGLVPTQKFYDALDTVLGLASEKINEQAEDLINLNGTEEVLDWLKAYTLVRTLMLTGGGGGEHEEQD